MFVFKKQQRLSQYFFTTCLIVFCMFLSVTQGDEVSLNQRCAGVERADYCNFDGKYSDNIYQLQHYLGTLYWDHKKSTANQLSAPTPMNVETILNGFNTEQANIYIQDNEFKPRIDLFSWNMDILQTGEQAQAEDLIERHQRDYCSLLEYNNGLCVNKVENPNLNDLSAYSLLGKNTLETDNLDRAYNAAFYFLKNITNPDPIPSLSKEEMYINYEQKILSGAGRNNLLAKYKQEAILSLAQTGLLTMLLDRVPATQDSQGKQYSKLALLENEATRRFASKDWHIEMNKATTPTLLREMANMMAFNLLMQYRDSQRLERIEAVLDTQLSTLAQIGSMSATTKQKIDGLQQQEQDRAE